MDIKQSVLLDKEFSHQRRAWHVAVAIATQQSLLPVR